MKKTLVKVLTITALLLTGSAANAQDFDQRDFTLTPAESRELFDRGSQAIDIDVENFDMQEDRGMLTETSSFENEDYQDAISKRVFNHSFIEFERPTQKI